MEKQNFLGKEKSPYLLQHKDNPVHWCPWGDAAFEAARRENKPIFLSIGYSTCYWCHVMEKDSFEEQEVADVLNEHYISIKVDREEHPDVDQIYMDAVMAMTGQGGWPMSVLLTPELKPFFGGTFYYRAQFLQILRRIHEHWISNPQQIAEAAKELTSIIAKDPEVGAHETLDEAVLRSAFTQFRQGFDSAYGGFGHAPKFPRSDSLSLLLRIHRRADSAEALEMATKTLDAMARGGIYDHLGGGFHRYSTDEKWIVPHFEKMLYDNALLAVTYLEAYQVTGSKMYREVARETLDYVLRDMTDPQGGFYSAEDAGEVGKEGEFYVWAHAELAELLSKEKLAKLEHVYGVTKGGNFEHGNNILSLQPGLDWVVKKDDNSQVIQQKLFQARGNRHRPRRDDKILTSWNGLMIAALAKGYQVLSDEQYLVAAQKAALFIESHLYKNAILLRRYRDNDARFEGTLEDYAYLIDSLLQLYQSDFNPKWLVWAIALQTKQDELFWENGYCYTAKDAPSLIIRKKEFHDGAIPSPNAVSALNLLRLYDLTFERGYQERAKELFQAMSGAVNNYPSAFSSSLIALDYFLEGGKEVIVVGKLNSVAAGEIRDYLFKSFAPNKVISFGDPAPRDDTTALPAFRGREVLNNQTTIYVCENNTCKLPTNDLEEVRQLAGKFKKYAL